MQAGQHHEPRRDIVVSMLSKKFSLTRPGGAFYAFPEAPAGTTGVELSAGQFQMILDGIDLSRVKRFKRFAGAGAGP